MHDLESILAVDSSFDKTRPQPVEALSHPNVHLQDVNVMGNLRHRPFDEPSPTPTKGTVVAGDTANVPGPEKTVFFSGLLVIPLLVVLDLLLDLLLGQSLHP